MARNMKYIGTEPKNQPAEEVYIANLPGGGSSYVLPAATTDALGGVKQAAHVDGASGTVANIVDALVAAGIMASA